MFHVHNGLFIYAPILLFSVAGLFLGLVNCKRNYLLILIILTLSTYIFGSWWAWWFGGAYGHRCYVDLLPLFAIPMARILDRIRKGRSILLKLAVSLLLIVFLWYSIGMTEIYHSPWDGPDFGWPEYWEQVRKVFPLG